MAKSVTVTFDDGTSHTYDNVPDDVTDDQVTQRAGGDFTDKTITGVVGGAAPAANTEMPGGAVAPQELGFGEKAVGAAATAANLAMQHPAIPAAAAGLWKANKVANAYIKSKEAEAAASQARTAQQAETAAAQLEQSRARMAERMARAGGVAQPGGLVDAAGNPISSAPKPTMSAMPGAGAGPAPTMPEAPPSSSNYMSRMTQLAERYLPAAKSAVGAVGRVAAPVARVLGSAPAMGAQLMLHSGGLNTNEDAELARRRQMGFQQ